MIAKWFERMWSLYFSKVHGRRCCRIVTSLIHSIGRQRAICNMQWMIQCIFILENMHQSGSRLTLSSRLWTHVRATIQIPISFKSALCLDFFRDVLPLSLLRLLYVHRNIQSTSARWQRQIEESFTEIQRKHVSWILLPYVRFKYWESKGQH